MDRRSTNRKLPASIKLDEGTAHHMEDGMFVVDFVDEEALSRAARARVTLWQ